MIAMLRILRKQRGISMKKLGEAVGVAESTISQYETGKREADYEMLLRLSEYFNVSIDYLLRGDSVTPSPVQGGIRIPVLGRIPAGVPLEAIEDVIDWEDLSGDMTRGGKQYFALQIKGDSMEPEYLDGDVIIVLKQESAETGEDVVVMVNGYDATFKRLSKVEDGIILRPINPKYDPLHFSAEDVRGLPVKVLGICIELRRKKH